MLHFQHQPIQPRLNVSKEIFQRQKQKIPDQEDQDSFTKKSNLKKE